EDEQFTQVVPIGTGARSRTSPFGLTSRPRPWTPRESAPPTPAPRIVESPLTAPSTRFTVTHRWMLAGFGIITVGMILGMVMVRVWDEASRAVAALPAEGSTATRPAATSVAPGQQTGPADARTEPTGSGPITTEIRVLEPNYTVAPGD